MCQLDCRTSAKAKLPGLFPLNCPEHSEKFPCSLCLSSMFGVSAVPVRGHMAFKRDFSHGDLLLLIMQSSRDVTMLDFGCYKTN